MAAAAEQKMNGRLTVTVGEGKDLADVTIGTMDPLAKLELGAEKFSTKVAKAGGRKPAWNQSFLFNVDAKASERIHIHVFAKGLLSDTPIGRLDIPIETLLKAKSAAFYQLVSNTDFSKIAGNISLSAQFEGTGGPVAPAAATATAAAAAPVAVAQPQIVYQQQPQVIYQQPVVYQQPQVMYQQPQVAYQPYGGAAAAVIAQPKIVVAAAAAPSNRCSAANKQAGWRWCSRCQVLWYALSNNSLGVCAAGGGHNYQGSGHYHAPLQSGNGCNGQSGWRWCCRCMGMFYGAAISVCPAGGAHDASGSGDYTMCLGNQHGQYGWGWCSRCGVFWYTANKASSYCPSGGNHDNAGSPNYQLGHD